MTTIAGAVASVKPKKSDFSAQNAYAATIATAPVARLMIPDPRYVTTTAMRDAGDHRAGPEAEQDEESDVLHRLCSLGTGEREGWRTAIRSIPRADPRSRRRAPSFWAPLYL